jgi:hypothetical protein
LESSELINVRMTFDEQEELWAKQLHECRVRLVNRVTEAVAIPSPGKRTELYQSWRKLYGDDVARESAKYAEGVLAGRLSLHPLKKMIGL